MYIHAGAGKLIRGEEIIGVFDMDGHVDSEVNRGFLKSAEKSGVTSSAGSDLPRSFIVVCADGRENVVFSHISVSGVKERLSRKQI